MPPHVLQRHDELSDVIGRLAAHVACAEEDAGDGAPRDQAAQLGEVAIADDDMPAEQFQLLRIGAQHLVAHPRNRASKHIVALSATMASASVVAAAARTMRAARPAVSRQTSTTTIASGTSMKPHSAHVRTDANMGERQSNARGRSAATNARRRRAKSSAME